MPTMRQPMQPGARLPSHAANQHRPLDRGVDGEERRLRDRALPDMGGEERARQGWNR